MTFDPPTLFAIVAIAVSVIALIALLVFRARGGRARIETTDASIASAPAVDASLALSRLKGITSSHEEALRQVGVHSMTDLLERCADDESLHTLCDATKLEDFVLLRLAAAADLLRIPGMTEQGAEALSFGGVRSWRDLATRDPERLHHRLSAMLEKAERSEDSPSLDDLRGLVQRAQSMQSGATDAG